MVVWYPSIGNYIKMKKIPAFRGEKDGNKPSETINGIWGLKSVWSCDISIVGPNIILVEYRLEIFMNELNNEYM
jgi:hypothetical protein